MVYTAPDKWIDIIRREYLHDFIRLGGSAVKFAITADEISRDGVLRQLSEAAREEDFLFVSVDAARAKIHMMDKLFHEVARQVDWDALAYDFVTRILTENGYKAPHNREEFNLQQIASANNREEKHLRKDIHGWLESAIYRDYQMSQEFRIAMIHLCRAQLDPGNTPPYLSNAVKEWLRGELRFVSTLKEALIFQKVARHNARHMLFSLVHWLRRNNRSGLVLALDISRYLVTKRPRTPDETYYYNTPATIDAYEMLRQFIDGTDEVDGLLVITLAPSSFMNDERRGIGLYDALRLRISDEVRDVQRQNPLGSLIRISTDQLRQDSAGGI